jgi:hypothetical protein
MRIEFEMQDFGERSELRNPFCEDLKSFDKLNNASKLGVGNPQRGSAMATQEVIVVAVVIRHTFVKHYI